MDNNIKRDFMSETWFNIRVESNTKKHTKAVFTTPGMNMNTGENLFLPQVVRLKAIPLKLDLNAESLERRMREFVVININDMKESGTPVAQYDYTRNCPYLEYLDGRREYKIK